MNTEQNFDKMRDDLAAYMNGTDGKQATIILITDFGGYNVLQVRLHSVELAPYAQYRNALRITCTPKGKRTKWRMTLHEGKEFAIFAGWVTPSKEIGTTTRTADGVTLSTWTACDKNEFYKLVDSTDGAKIAEQSERIYLDELKKRGKVYEVYTVDGCTEYKTESELLQDHEKRGTVADSVRRYELQGTPILAGLCGPMFDGYDENNNARIRYESSDLYAILSE